MTQEDKELLLKDLCARLPYHCRIFYEYVDDLDNKTYGYSLTLNTWCIDEFNADKAVVKPYLRPMSSMTDEEKKEFIDATDGKLRYSKVFDVIRPMHASEDYCVSFVSYLKAVDWLNKYHFDYHGLILMGLALEAPDDMYRKGKQQ